MVCGHLVYINLQDKKSFDLKNTTKRVLLISYI